MPAPSEYEQPTLKDFLSNQYQIESRTEKVEPTPPRDVESVVPAPLQTERNTSSKDPIMHRHSSIALDTRDDPFAPREGKTLTWQNINMVLAGEKGEKDRNLLENVWGEVPARQTTAIMGPSGAGKTSLLNILAGRATTRGRITINSDIRLNNYVVDPTNVNVRKQIAFVAQDDSLQVTSTPRESIFFSAKLRLPRYMTDQQLQKLTKRMIAELGLEDCADTIVGGELIKGISGGQRKRTSVGVELVTKPALVFLDEPTSGLDSYSAVQLCQVLKKVANAGSSVLFTIHQPSSEIFNSFDQLILMNRGRVMYQGPVGSVPDYFGARNHPNPPNYNPADWVMNVAQSVSQDQLVADGFYPKDTRNLGDAFTPEDGKDALGITLTKRHKAGTEDSRRVSMLVEIQKLFGREISNLRRDTVAVGARFGLTLFLGVLIGVIFLNVGKTDPAQPSNLQSQFGSLIMVMLMGMFGTAQPALLAFPEERPVFLREYSTNHYNVVSYFLSRLTMEAFITFLQVCVQVVVTYFLIGFQSNFGEFLIIAYALAMSSTALAVLLGCSVEDPKLAQEMLPILFVPQMLFAGFFVAPSLIPVWLRWAQYLCTLTYAIKLILVAEFDRDCGSPEGNASCEALLDRIDADQDNVWWYWLVLVGLFVLFRVGAVIVLRKKATKFY